jgi:hypothetical protein
MPPNLQLHTSSISVNIEDDDPNTPKVPRGKRSDVSEKDLVEFTQSFSHLLLAEHLE